MVLFLIFNLQNVTAQGYTTSCGKETTSRTQEKQIDAFDYKDWKKIVLGKFVFYVPPDFDLKLKAGLDSSYWAYSGPDIEFFVDLRPNMPRPDAHEQSLISYKDEKVWINSIFVWKWSYVNEQLKFRYVSVARFYAERKASGEGAILSLRSSNEECKKIAENIFQSVRLK